MSTDSLISLAGFAFVMSLSPGPANLLLLASGANHGYLRSLPLLLGISCGFLMMVGAVGIGLGQLLASHPGVDLTLRLLCGGYVIYLAWQLAKLRQMGSELEQQGIAPLGFIQASLLQWLNPKAWAVALMLNIAYASAATTAGLLSIIIVFALVNLPTISLWALSGTALRRWLSTEGRLVSFNRLMALLLLATMLPMLVTN